ncbi:hypothetical protein BDY19DRAFT_997247 [Irpex rosettiformis]|uniref:Uncharacterized protein n=1 Tax=Irpex rosettiformis TaxID=378272 RepID=A0ACB8TSP7_9APHY|nr:hypothetical protein BDY19DRAFT_997247 [Irpex rosettiformis]
MSLKLEEYFFTQAKLTLAQFAIKLEAYCLTGMGDVAKNYHKEILHLRSQCATLIGEKFSAIVAPYTPRLIYQGFHSVITLKYGVIVEGWSLPVFHPPGDLGSCVELETLFHTWNMGVAKFVKLTSKQLQEGIKQWRD